MAKARDSAAPDAIALEVQLDLFEDRWLRVVGELQSDLKRLSYLNHLHDLARDRLIAGHARYGDEMYRWGEACREANMDEELADYIVYGTSEP